MTWLTTCAREGCDREPKVRGYCRSHYAVANKWGEFAIPPRLSLEERFWSKVEKTESCWLWVGGSLSPGGYGLFAETARKQVRAHRLAYELVVGPIPDGLVMDHLCRNRACVNPDHLEPVADAENVRRGISPAAINGRLTKCRRGHEFEVVRWANRTQRVCKECERARKRRQRQAAK